MLRNIVFVIGICVLAASALAAATGAVGAWVPLAWGAILAAAIAFERFRYKPLEHAAPGLGWEKTPERFIDEETGKPVTVYIEKKTGERRYVQD